jgi:hypothetical protein
VGDPERYWSCDVASFIRPVKIFRWEDLNCPWSELRPLDKGSGLYERSHAWPFQHARDMQRRLPKNITKREPWPGLPQPQLQLPPCRYSPVSNISLATSLWPYTTHNASARVLRRVRAQSSAPGWNVVIHRAYILLFSFARLFTRVTAVRLFLSLPAYASYRSLFQIISIFQSTSVDIFPSSRPYILEISSQTGSERLIESFTEGCKMSYLAEVTPAISERHLSSLSHDRNLLASSPCAYNIPADDWNHARALVTKYPPQIVLWIIREVSCR